MVAEFDAVLIGAGHNCLAAALHLGSRGWRVGVFEQGPQVGGAVRTGEYTLPGFRHDWGAMNLSLFAGSPFMAAHGETLRAHGLDFVRVDRPFASSFPDGSWAGVSTDLGETLESIRALSPADADAFAAMLESGARLAPQLGGVLGARMTSRGLIGAAWGAVRAGGRRGALDLGRMLLQSPRAFLEERFTHPHVRALLAIWGMHLDFAPDIAGGAIFPYLEALGAQAQGMVLGAGGADIVTRAMTAVIAAQGGVVQTGAPVARILHERGRARGIMLADGSRITARRAVIAGVAPGALVRLTGGTTPAFDAAMTAFRHAPGTMMIHLALDGLPDWRAGEALRRFAYVHIAPSLDAMARTYQQASAGLLPDAPGLVVGQPTVFDPSRAPGGRHVLWVQVRMAPGTILGDAAGTIAARDWAGAAEPFAARALDILESHAPGLRARILGQRIVSPAELEADNPNLVGGDQICGSHHLAQNFLYRPAPGHADGSTPIRRLHLTGAAVWPGAGTGAGPGFLLARRLAGG